MTRALVDAAAHAAWTGGLAIIAYGWMTGVALAQSLPTPPAGLPDPAAETHAEASGQAQGTRPVLPSPLVTGVLPALNLTPDGSLQTAGAGAVPPLAVAVAALPADASPSATEAPQEAEPARIDLQALSEFARTVFEGTGFEGAGFEGTGQDAALRAFYTARDFAPIWTSAGDAERRSAFFAALDGAAAQGLPAERYGAADLRAAFSSIRSERERGLLEAQMSRTWLRYARDVSSGVLEPKRVDSGIVREIIRPDPLLLISGFAGAATPARYLRDLAPKDPRYGLLLRARLDLGRQIKRGGWDATVPAAALAPGASGPAVVALRDRLQAMGYLGRSSSAAYDGALQKAVQLYQIDNGLKPDGVAGPATLTAINHPPEARLKAILVALERLRWMNGLDLGQRHIWVNIPDFTTRLVDHGKTTFETVSVVGKNDPDRRTPEFSDEMEMMVINPSWHVPRSITVKEYLPKMKKNRNAASQIVLVDSRGREVPRSQVDFSAYDEKTFPYRMRQKPSDDNALGLVKFLFPNPWNIYLHDTPSKALFSEQMRAFSHGCIRLQKPFDFAYELLAPQQADPEAYFQKVLKTGKETTVRLDPPVPVHLVYFTAWPGNDGRIEYRDDVYGRDAALFDALERAGVELPVLAN